MRPNTDVPDLVRGSSKCTTGRSYHSGVVMVGLCDGSVRSVSDTIDFAAWHGSWTRAGNEVQTVASE